jgi:hypothetical protein
MEKNIFGHTWLQPHTTPLSFLTWEGVVCEVHGGVHIVLQLLPPPALLLPLPLPLPCVPPLSGGCPAGPSGGPFAVGGGGRGGGREGREQGRAVVGGGGGEGRAWHVGGGGRQTVTHLM